MLFFADFGVVDRLKGGADLERTNWAYASPEHNAPKLLGYIPSYNTTLAAHKKSRATRAKKVDESSPSQAPDARRPLRGRELLPLNRATPDPFSKSSTEMPRAPFKLVNLKDDTTLGDAFQTATPVDKETETIATACKCHRPEARGKDHALLMPPRDQLEHQPPRIRTRPRIQCGTQ